MNWCSQCGQDRFVHFMIPRPGTFLDIGSGGPDINNTLALEELGWTGFLIDCSQEALEASKGRKARFFLADSRIVDWSFLPSRMDYLSFDVDQAMLETMNMFPFSKARFNVITMEHNLYYPEVYQGLQAAQRAKLSWLGYKLVCSNVKNGGKPIEDWWVDPGFVSADKIEAVRCDGLEWTEIVNKL